MNSCAPHRTSSPPRGRKGSPAQHADKKQGATKRSGAEHQPALRHMVDSWTPMSVDIRQKTWAPLVSESYRPSTHKCSSARQDRHEAGQQSQGRREANVPTITRQAQKHTQQQEFKTRTWNMSSHLSLRTFPAGPFRLARASIRAPNFSAHSSGSWEWGCSATAPPTGEARETGLQVLCALVQRGVSIVSVSFCSDVIPDWMLWVQDWGGGRVTGIIVGWTWKMGTSS